MSFSNNVPDKVLENPYAYKFLQVLDSLQDYKLEEIHRVFRVNKTALCNDRKWLLKKLQSFGFELPLDYPLANMQQILLNISTFLGTRGSKAGLELFLSVLTFGEVEIDDSQFFAEEDMLILDSLLQGFVTADNSQQSFFLVDDSDALNVHVELSMNIKSKYFNGEYPTEEAIIKSFISENIGRWLGFSPDRTINITYEARDEFYYHNLLNNYFV